jgi:hypothetical protein
MIGTRDVELLSAYLDGQLSAGDLARIESRLASDAELTSVLDDLRLARSALRKLPALKAPRNFLLTKRMVGERPPMPRAYPVFRFASAFATLLLIFTAFVNSIIPRVSFGAAAPAAEYGFGGGPGIGGDCGEPCGLAPSLQLGAATEAVAESEVSPSFLLTAPAALTPSASQDIAGATEAPPPAGAQPKEEQTAIPEPELPQVRLVESVIPNSWQLGLLGLALVCAGAALYLRWVAKNKWS